MSAIKSLRRNEDIVITNQLNAVSQPSSVHNDMQVTNETTASCSQCYSNGVELQQMSFEIQELKERILASQSKRLPNQSALNSLFNLLNESTS